MQQLILKSLLQLNINRRFHRDETKVIEIYIYSRPTYFKTSNSILSPLSYTFYL